LHNSQWKKATDLRQGSTLHYLETPGAPKPYNNILKDRDIETIRKVGL
jgi:hypothetical protein